MEYKYPTLPEPDLVTFDGADYGEEFAKELWYYTDNQMRQYAEQAVAPLLAEIERLEDLLLERGEADSLD